MKKVKIFAVIMTMMMAGAVLSGCGKKTTDKPSAKESKELVVWSHLTDPEVAELDKVAKQWATKTGNTVKVVADRGDFGAYTAAAQSPMGPDIMYGIPHNEMAPFQKANLLDEVPAGVIEPSKYANQSVIDGVTWGGKKYGVPVAMETYGLFYNTEKVKEAPKTVEELLIQARKVGFQYDINGFYYNYAWIASNGGYVFKNNNGTLDPKDIGLGNAGAQKAYKWIQDLVQVEKFMKADIKGDDAKGAFFNNKIGFYISGPWDVDAFKKSGVKFAVAPLPKVDGKAAKSFMSIQAAFVSSKSKNKTEAWDLMKYLMENSSQPLFTSGHRMPVLKAELDKDYFKEDKFATGFAEQAKSAEPIPNISEINATWGPTGNNFPLLNQGKQDAAKTAELIVNQIKEGIAQQK